MQLGIFSEIDFAHPTFANQRKNVVVGHCLPRFEFQPIHQHLGCCLIGRSVNEVTGFFVRLD